MFHLRESEEEKAFRKELRTWLEENLPPGWLEGKRKLPEDEADRREFQRSWQRRLAAGRWVGVQWPREYGGRGATLREQMIYTEEMARVRAPGILDPVAVNIVGPVLIQYGTEEQKRRYLPPILPGDEVWCLGFSEPNAGSDLASLRTRAERDGDFWVVSGQKVWSSKAHFARWMLLLARTDPDVPKHKGLSCFIVDMRSPGVSWRPLVQISGLREFNEVFLDQVRVPAENLLGPPNGGWPVIRAALAHERGTLWAFDFKVRLQNGALALADLYRRCVGEGLGRGAEARLLRQAVAQAYIEAEVFGAHTLRILPRLHAAAEAPPEAALQKLFGSEIQQRACELAMALEGTYAQLFRDRRWAIDGGEWQEQYLYSRSTTISSGTSEVLRNLLAQRALGLPRN
ncbi:MAG: putative acyl-CoA dehydrogenase FadE [Candidatus Binatia bacterium]|nr:MAG: putative acyl-CoA dehydrogenase FadE [Candidatus Binatia bacterium]